MLPFAYKDIFDDSFRNDKKHEKRRNLYGEYHGYEDGIFELYHKEYAANLDYIEEIFAYEKRIRQEEIERLDAAMQELTEIQRRRLQMRYYEKLDVHQIAMKEQRSRSAVKKSIKDALKKIQDYFSK